MTRVEHLSPQGDAVAAHEAVAMPGDHALAANVERRKRPGLYRVMRRPAADRTQDQLRQTTDLDEEVGVVRCLVADGPPVNVGHHGSCRRSGLVC